MPQLSLYIDEQTLKKIEIAAKLEKLSISKYVVKKLNESINKSWPQNFQSLYGSIQDETFNIPEEIDHAIDSQREEL
ncbi:MAG: toxin-antitoxin system, antitoxin component [Spirochaetota bacterium]